MTRPEDLSSSPPSSPVQSLSNTGSRRQVHTAGTNEDVLSPFPRELSDSLETYTASESLQTPNTEELLASMDYEDMSRRGQRTHGDAFLSSQTLTIPMTPRMASETTILSSPLNPLRRSTTLSSSQMVGDVGDAILSSSTIGTPRQLPQRRELGSRRREPIELASSASRNELASSLTDPLNGPRGPLASSRSHEPGGSSALFSDPVNRATIWGTNISVVDCMENFRWFLENFCVENGGGSLYLQRLKRSFESEQYHLDVNCSHLLCNDRTKQLYHHLVNYPSDIVPLLDSVATEVFYHKFVSNAVSSKMLTQEQAVTLGIQVRPYSLTSSINMRELDPNDIDKLVAVRGLVIRTSTIIPDMQMAFFKCLICEQTIQQMIDRGSIEEPIRCSRCETRHSLMLVHNRCRFISKQLVRVQETPELIPEGQTPHTITLIVYDQLVDAVRPGDRIEVTGIYRATSSRPNPRTRHLLQLYRTYLDVLNMQRLDRRHFQMMDETTDIRDRELIMQQMDSISLTTTDSTPAPHLQTGSFGTDNETILDKVSIARLHAIAAQPNVYERLSRSLAPSIFEMDDIKKGILCQLFGGVNKHFEKRGTGRFRGDINVLLVGDPGTSKSQLLQYVHKIAPRGIYTSGKGSSAVGLTAYVTRDPETKQLVLESGALVLSDGGICCIDEFDKMSDGTRAVLHEVMEQQTVSVAKAGIICSLNARTAVLASANPKSSQYDPNLSVVENIQLPPTLLSRFDLIYLVVDRPDEVRDRELARHLVSLYYADSPNRLLKRMHTGQEGIDGTTEYILNMDTLTRYITYARQRFHPRLTDEAIQRMIDGYLAMRRTGQGRHNIAATPRQLESLIRLSEAHARIRFSDTVEAEDVIEALRLVNVARQQAATDPLTGIVDMDIITTGKSNASRQRIVSIASELKRFMAATSGAMNRSGQLRFHQLYQSFLEKASGRISLQDMKDAVSELEREEFITVTGDLHSGNAMIRRF